MKKKVFLVILTAALILCACGDDKGGTASEATQTEVLAPVSGNTEAPKESIEPSTEPATVVPAAESEVPEGIEQPKTTKAPDSTEKPEVTSGAAAMEKPEDAALPETAVEPKTAREPEKNKEDSATAKPVNTEMPAGSAPTEVPHTCTWDGGNITTAATCSSEGVKTYTCTGCGKTRTEGIPETVHNYVTETKSATCTEAGGTKTYCSACGEVQSETSSGAPAGHNFVKEYWPSEPTCTSGGSYNMICSMCGQNGGSGSDPALDHTAVSREIYHGNCVEDTIIEITCSECGAYLGCEAHTEDEHDWVEGTYEEFDPETHSVVIKTSVQCGRCGKMQ